MAPFVLALMYCLGIIAYPTAGLLDLLLGKDHGTVYKKSGLKTLVTLHKTMGPNAADRLNQDEVTIISAVLDLKEKPIGDIMTPMDDVFTMSTDTVLDEETMNVILGAGYSRIPIYEPGNELNFVGMLLVKILITYDPEDCKRVGEFALATLPETRPETSCLDIVNFFQEGKSHMVLVSESPGENAGAIGVVTLEDVIEELIGEEIIDESDVYIDVHKAIRRMHPAPKARIPKGQIVGQQDGQLIDLREDGLTKQIQRRDSRSNTAAIFSPSSPKTTFLRRASTGNDGKTIQVRGNANDMREHLKHLGPSNLASRPKTTRYQTVKIKPGLGLLKADSRGTTNGVIDEPYTDLPAPGGGEGEGLLKSAGKEASDGVHALQQGYGSMDAPSSRNGPKPEPLDLEEPIHDPSMSFRNRSRTALSRNMPGSTIFDGHRSQTSSDTLGSLKSDSSSPTYSIRKKRTARSGSITENIIEAGGVRKVVLETNSSGDDDKAQDTNAGNQENVPPKPFLTLLGSQNDLLEEQAASSQSGVVDGSKKKRRRKRKAKQGEESVASSSAQQ